ncbi:MAG: tRNA (adenine(22)-N(1))-methyltransferase [Bacilli bacterium]
MKNKRLEAILNLINEDMNIIDIGCDHAYLAIEVAKKFNNSKIIASDINKNALSFAAKNIKNNNLTNKIAIKLQNGIDYIGESNTAIIAGMGAYEILHILNSKNTSKLDTFIVSPNNNHQLFREKLNKLGLIIDYEQLIFDKKWYLILVLKKGNKIYSYEQTLLGPKLLENKDVIFKKYYNQVLKKLKLIYIKIPKYDSVTKRKFKKKIKIIDKNL